MTKNNNTLLSARFITMVVCLTICVFFAGYVYFSKTTENLRNKTLYELRAISTLKSEHVEEWYVDENKDAYTISHNIFFKETLEAFLIYPTLLNKERAKNFLKSIVNEHGIDRIFVVDANKNIVLQSLNDSLQFFNLYHLTHPFADTVFATDIHAHNNKYSKCIDFISPVIINSSKYYIVFQHNANSFLLSYISSSFNESKTLESVLIQPERDSVLLLNPVRDSAYKDKKISIPQTDTIVAAVKAALGYEGEFRGEDYRHEKIIAYIKKIPNTPWSIITKIDEAEMFETLKSHAIIVIIFSILILAFLIFAIAFLFANKQRKIYRNLFKIQQEFRTTLYSIGDGVITTDKKGRVKYMNPIAESLTGWKEDEAKGRLIEDVFTIINEQTREKVENPVARVLLEGTIIGLANHTILINKNGTEVPIADSGAPIRKEDKTIIGVILVFRDQTDEYAKQKKIADSNRKLSSLISNLQGVAYSCLNTSNWDVLFISDSCKILTGYTKEDFLDGKTINYGSIIHPDDRQMVYDEIQHAIIQKDQFKFEYRIVTKDQEIKWVWEQGKGIYNEMGNLEVIEGYIVDISYQKNLYYELEKSKHILQLILDTIPSKVYWKDLNLNFLGGNKTFLKDANLNSIQELKGKNDYDIIWNNRADVYRNDDKEVITSGIPKLYFEDEIPVSDKESLFFRTSILPLRNNKGEIEGVLGIYDDISNQKIAEKSIKLQIRAIEQSPVSIIITNSDGNIEYVNPKFCEVTGYSFSETIGKNPSILKSGYQNAEFYKNLWDTIKIGKDWNGELHNKKKNGELYWEQANISPITNSKGEITHFVAVKEDITEKKAMLEDLIIAKEKAEESDKLKSAFLANMSHEIRTPMNGIIGFSEMLTDSNLEEDKRQEYAKIVVNSSKQLLTIVNDILDISRIEAGEVHISIEKFPINSLLNEIYLFFKPQTYKKGLKFELQTAFEDDDCLIETDKTRLRQVIINLIGNAIKFTEEGSVSFGYTLGENTINFYVKDTGIGISEHMHNHIFDRFRQAELDISKQYGGTGLGLSISQKLIRILGGEIQVESELNKGSHFFFTIPHNESLQITKVIPPIIGNIDFNNAIILIAEDDDANFQLLEIMLKKQNLLILRAKNGNEAIKLCNEISNIQFVLMDIRMPGMDGLSAIKAIKSNHPELPIVVQTAYKIDEEKEKAFEAGCDDYITKPIKKQQLLTYILKHIKKHNE